MTMMNSIIPSFMAAALTIPVAGSLSMPFQPMGEIEAYAFTGPIQVNDAGAELLRAMSFQRLRDIQSLPDNWDGAGAPAIPQRVIQQLQNILTIVHFSPEIYPTGRATVQFQYEKQDRSYLEFEVYSDHIDMLYVPQRHYNEAVTRRLQPEEWIQIDGIVTQFFEV